MEVILRRDIPSLGEAGSIVKVKDGYGRNHLIPAGLAYLASPGNKKRVEAEAKARSERIAMQKEGAEEMEKALSDVELTITAKAGEEGKLFGSVTSADIAARLAEAGHDIDKRTIELDEPIKQLGEQNVTIKLHPEVRVEVKVRVEPEEQ